VASGAPSAASTSASGSGQAQKKEKKVNIGQAWGQLCAQLEAYQGFRKGGFGREEGSERRGLPAKAQNQ